MEILQKLKEGQFAALDPLFNFPKLGHFEDGSGKPKPLLAGALISFAARKCLQHGKVEHLFAILEGQIACAPYVYWLSAVRDVSFFYYILNLSKKHTRLTWLSLHLPYGLSNLCRAKCRIG